MAKKNRSPRVDELRDPITNISTEDHHRLFARLLAAGAKGIHGAPGAKRNRGG